MSHGTCVIAISTSVVRMAVAVLALLVMKGLGYLLATNVLSLHAALKPRDFQGPGQDPGRDQRVWSSRRGTRMPRATGSWVIVACTGSGPSTSLRQDRLPGQRHQRGMDPGHPESPIHRSLAKVGLLHSQVVQGEGSKLQEFCEKLAEEKPRGGTEEGVRRFC